MPLRGFLGLLFALTSVCIFSFGEREFISGEWKPKKQVTIIVPQGAGGFTDQVMRILAAEMEGTLGQKVVLVNRPGAEGAAGTKSAFDAPHDGYTWVAGAAADLGTYKLRGLFDTTWEDWVLYLCVANVSVVAVNTATPYQTFADLLTAFEETEGEISVATAGKLSSGHHAIEAIQKYTGIRYRHVAYDGSNSAMISVLAGETDVITQLGVEEADMLVNGKLRALTVLDNRPLELKDYGTIYPVTNWIQDFVPTPDFYGIWIPRDVPPEVINTIGEFWDTVVRRSHELKEFTATHGAILDPVWGEEAVMKALPYLEQVAWSYYDARQTKMPPSEIGIKRPN